MRFFLNQVTAAALVTLGCVGSYAQAPTPAAESEPEKLVTVIKLLNTYSGQGDNMARAINLAGDMGRANPNSAYANAALAEVYFANGQAVPVVLETAKRAIALNPRVPEPYVVLVRLYLKTGNLATARTLARSV